MWQYIPDWPTQPQRSVIPAHRVGPTEVLNVLPIELKYDLRGDQRQGVTAERLLAGTQDYELFSFNVTAPGDGTREYRCRMRRY